MGGNTGIEVINRVIRADEAYTVENFKLRTGLGDFAFAKARREGLKVSPVGKKMFVRGSDWIEFLGKQLEKQRSK